MAEEMKNKSSMRYLLPIVFILFLGLSTSLGSVIQTADAQSEDSSLPVRDSLGIREVYHFDLYEFSMVPPVGWDIVDAPVSDTTNTVSITSVYDDVDSYTSFLNVNFFKNDIGVENYKGQQYLDYLANQLSDLCESTTMEFFGYGCSNFDVTDKKITEINGKTAYQLTYSTTEVYPDQSSFNVINTVIDIPVNKDLWSIYYSTIEGYDSDLESLKNSVESFMVSDKGFIVHDESKPKGTVIGSGQSIWKNRLADGFTYGSVGEFDTFTDLSLRPFVLVSPEKFTSEWYVNNEHNLAIKFPEPVQENWNIDENVGGNTIALLTSPETGAKLRINYGSDPQLTSYLSGLESPNIFGYLAGEEKSDLYVVAENALFNNFKSSPEKTILGGVGITKYSDGLLFYSTFFDQGKDESDVMNFMLNDISILTFNDGRMYEILYYGDTYEALTFNDVTGISDSIYIGDVSKIKQSLTERETDTGIYVNEQYDVTYTPPEGWIHESIQLEIEGASAFARFYPRQYETILPGTIVLSYENLHSRINLDDSDKKILDKFTEMIFQAALQYGQKTEIKNKDIERFENYVKITLHTSDTISTEDTPLEFETDMVVWILDNNDSYNLQYLILPEDFKNNVEEFRETISSFKVGDKIDVSGNDISIPDWIKNNAKWWVDGTINDQAFVGGIEFLIKEGILQIPETTKSATGSSQDIPSWIKNNADWWSKEMISDKDFLKGIEFLVKNGIIVVS